MAMANTKPQRHITKVRAGVNKGPGSKAPSGSDFSLGEFGGGRVTNKGLKHSGIDWKNR